MGYKTALLALALVCAPWITAEESVARQNRWDDSATVAFNSGVIINNTGMDFSRGYSSQDADDYYDESWKSIRTFKLQQNLRRPIKVYVESYPQETRLYKPQYAQYVQEGLNAWSEALDGRIQYVMTNNPREANIRVNWVARFSIPDQAGETEFTIGDASVKIQTVGYPDNVIKGNIIHELGHALGIGEHSTHNDDIMVACREWKSYQEYKSHTPKLSERDKLAIRRLYSPQWRKGEDVYRAIATNPSLLIAANNRSASVAGQPGGPNVLNRSNVKVQPAPRP